jgi:hypothetical protein
MTSSSTWLSGVTRDQHSDGGDHVTGYPPRGVLHTTEGRSWPDYSGWTHEPHLTVMPLPGEGILVHQHLPLERSAYALKNPAGGVQTNRARAVQIELIGTCDTSDRTMYQWVEADDVVLAELWRRVIVPVSASMGIFSSSSVRWEPYPGSYGLRNPNRLSPGEWTSYNAWCGHAHVPENEHGDPGAFPWDRMVRVGTQSSGGNTVSSTAAVEVWKTNLNTAAGGSTSTNPDDMAARALRLTTNRVAGLVTDMEQVLDLIGMTSRRVDVLVSAVADLKTMLGQLGSTEPTS